MDDYYRDSTKEDQKYSWGDGVSKDKDSRRRMFWVSNRSRKRAEIAEAKAEAGSRKAWKQSKKYL